MKKILFALFLLATYSFAQTSPKPKILQLENSLSDLGSGKTFTENTTSFSESPSKKNAGLAILLSVLLPGMGELYADGYSSGRYFTIADGALWGIYFGMNAYSGWLKDRYISFAASSGGVSTQGKDANYFATIGDYTNIDEYNNAQALNQNFNGMYDPAKYNWSWQSTADRKSYRNMWVSSEQSHNNLRFVVGALILNRIASAINAVRLVSSYNKRLSAETSWNVSVGISNPQTLPSSLNFNFQTTF